MVFKLLGRRSDPQTARVLTVAFMCGVNPVIELYDLSGVPLCPFLSLSLAL